MAHQKTAQILPDLGGVVKNELEKTVFVDRLTKLPALNATMALSTMTLAAASIQTANRINGDWELQGANADDAGVTFADGGGITVQTASSANDQHALVPHQDTSQSGIGTWKWNTNDEIAIGVKIKTGASVSACLIGVGFAVDATVKATMVPAEDANSVYFFYRASGTNSSTYWQAVYNSDASGATDAVTALDSTTAVAASTEYELVIAVDSDRKANFYLDGELVHTTAALKANVDLVPRITLEALDTSEPTMTIRKIVLAKTSND